MDKTKKKRRSKNKKRNIKRKTKKNNVKLLPEIKPVRNIIDNAVNNRSSNQNNESNIQTQPRRPRIYKGKIVGYKTVKKPIREYDLLKVEQRKFNKKNLNPINETKEEHIEIKEENDNDNIICECGANIKKSSYKSHLQSKRHKDIMETLIKN